MLDGTYFTFGNILECVVAIRDVRCNVRNITGCLDQQIPEQSIWADSETTDRFTKPSSTVVMFLPLK